MIFWEIYSKASFEIIFSGISNSLELPVFGFSNSLPYMVWNNNNNNNSLFILGNNVQLESKQK